MKHAVSEEIKANLRLMLCAELSRFSQTLSHAEGALPGHPTQVIFAQPSIVIRYGDRRVVKARLSLSFLPHIVMTKQRKYRRTKYTFDNPVSLVNRY